MKLIFNLRLFDGAVPQGSAGTAQNASSAVNAQGEKSDTKIVYGIQDVDSNTETDIKSKGVEDNSKEDGDDTARVEAYNKFKKENKDLYQKDVDALLNKRFKETKGLTEKIEKLNPLLDMIADKYGIDHNDIDGLVNAYIDDPEQYKDFAESEGLTIEQAKKMRELEMFKNTQEAAQNRQNANATYENWVNQAEEMKEIYPEFDLSEEANNPDFLKVLSNGFTVQQAYELLHPDVQTQRLSREIASKQAANMASRQKRPAENGMTAASGVEVRSNVKNFTPEDRRKAIEQSRKNGSGSVRFS